jgi:hypothetical protein
VALVRTDVSEEPGASIRVTKIGELGTTQAATSNRRTLRRNTILRDTVIPLRMVLNKGQIQIVFHDAEEYFKNN